MYPSVVKSRVKSQAGFGMLETILASALLSLLLAFAGTLLVRYKNFEVHVEIEGNIEDLRRYVRNSLSCSESIQNQTEICDEGGYIAGKQSDGNESFAKYPTRSVVGSKQAVRIYCGVDPLNSTLYQVRAEFAYGDPYNEALIKDPFTNQKYDWRPLFDVPLLCTRPNPPVCIPGWKFVDGNGFNGINLDPTRSASHPSATVFNSKLYTTWSESNGTESQIRVALFNGSDSWTFVDGGGANGLNWNLSISASVPELVVFDSKLYAVWSEGPYFNQPQIRVKVYNGNDLAPQWIFVDGNTPAGLNRNPGSHAHWPKPLVFKSKLYITWWEDTGFDRRVVIKVYNGDDLSPSWDFVDGGGLGLNNSQPISYPQFGTVNGKLYVAWGERIAPPPNDYYSVHVWVYNGDDISPVWTPVDGGINGINIGRTGGTPSFATIGTQLYITWIEHDGSATHNWQTHVAAYNGDDSAPVWTVIDTLGNSSMNYNPTWNPAWSGSSFPQLINFDNTLYAMWNEHSAAKRQPRVAEFNGDLINPAWTFADNGPNGLNKDINFHGDSARFADYNGQLYAFWYEPNAVTNQIRAAVNVVCPP